MKQSAFFLVFVVLSSSAFGFNQSTELRGLKTVNVVVANLSDDLDKQGVQKERLATTLELALGKAGLVVLAPDQFDATRPTISLQVSAIKEPRGRFYATDITLACLDNVYNNRIAGPFDAIIWSRDVLQLLGAIDLGRIVDGEKRLIEMFVSDFSQANRP